MKLIITTTDDALMHLSRKLYQYYKDVVFTNTRMYIDVPKEQYDQDSAMSLALLFNKELREMGEAYTLKLVSLGGNEIYKNRSIERSRTA